MYSLVFGRHGHAFDYVLAFCSATKPKYDFSWKTTRESLEKRKEERTEGKIK